MNWTPWKTETRAEPMNYTDKIVSEILARSSGTAADVRALASVESAVGMFERCIGSATVTPQNPLTAAVTPSLLMLAGRALASRGNFVALIEVEAGAVRLTPCATWDISGEADPASWEYRWRRFWPDPTKDRACRGGGRGSFSDQLRIGEAVGWPQSARGRKRKRQAGRVCRAKPTA